MATENNENDCANHFVRITFSGQDSFTVRFKIKYNALLHKAGLQFARHAGISLSGIRLIFDGHRVGQNDTPKSLGLEDNDVIEVYQEQLSG